MERREYEPYGLPQEPMEGPGYTGHDHDADSQLVYMQQRYYDPLSGRFLSVDPVGVSASNGGNFNRYWYGNNNPYLYVDPDGRQSCAGSRITNSDGSCMSGGGSTVGIAGDGGMTQSMQTARRASMINDATNMASLAIFRSKANSEGTEGRSGMVHPTGKGLRGCDSQGCGHFGASRVRDGVPGEHQGQDYVSDPGQNVLAITDGTVDRVISGKYNGIVVGNGEGISWKVLYVDVNSSLKPGGSIRAGQSFGTAKDITERYEGITNHVHTKLRVNYKVVDPTDYIGSN